MRQYLWGKRYTLALLVAACFAQSAFAFEGADAIPRCPDLQFRALPVMNEKVLDWKKSERNQFHARAHVRGTIAAIYPDKNGHQHFEIQIGPDENHNLEVIYNEDFGALPSLKRGMRVDACGDFIVSTARSGPYPPSPAGAIIHWVHMNPQQKGHPPGYLWIEGKLFGQEADGAGPRRPRRGGNRIYESFANQY